MAVLREVRYFEERGREDIPDSAAAIYAKNDTLRDYVNNLNLTVQWYNKVRKETLEVEFPLIEQQVSAIDEQLKQALDSLTWNSETAWDYIQQTRDMVSLLTVHILYDNVIIFLRYVFRTCTGTCNE